MYESTLIIVFLFVCLQDLVWPKGWPLTTETGDVILHIGTIDESFIHFYDAYICVRPGKKGLVLRFLGSPLGFIVELNLGLWVIEELYNIFS